MTAGTCCAGDLIDLDAGRNVTEAARESARVETVGGLGEASMIVFAPDKVKHTVTVFTDVDCGYCARMHSQMADYNRLGIGIRYAAFPRAGIGSPTYEKMVSVWCAQDQHTAMTDAKAGIAVEPARCDNPVERHYGAGKAIGVNGTPAIVLQSGKLIPGYLAAAGAPRAGSTSAIRAEARSGYGVRVVYILAALVVVLGWLSFEMRARNRDVSQVLLAFTILAAVALAAAALGLY